MQMIVSGIAMGDRERPLSKESSLDLGELEDATFSAELRTSEVSLMDTVCASGYCFHILIF